MRDKGLLDMSLVEVSLDDIRGVSKVEVVGRDEGYQYWSMDTSEELGIMSKGICKGLLSGRGRG